MSITICAGIAVSAQTNYTWNGSAGTAWNNAANWTPNTGFPLAADHATIVTAANLPVLDMARSVTNLTLTSGTLDLNGFTLTSTGNGTFNGGAVNNGTLAPNSAAGTMNFAGTTFGAAVTGTTSVLQFNGSTFHAAVTLTKTGSGNDYSAGNTVFNSSATFSVTAGRLYLANTGTTTFNGNVVVNSTGTSGGLWMGQTSGTLSLAAGRTFTAGTFTTGSLLFRNFTQAGTTAQNVVLTLGATLYFQAGSIFNGSVTTTSPGLYLNGATFNGACKFTKTGATNEYCSGGNVFNGTTEFVITGPGQLNLNNTGADQLNGDVLLNCTGTGGMRSGLSGGSSALASGRTLSIGSGGWSSGPLSLRNMSLPGSTAQVLSLTGTASLTLDANTVFGGNLTASAPNVLLNGCTVQGNARFIKTGPNDDWSTGGNTFNGDLELVNNSGYTLGMDNTGVDAMNGNVILSNTSTGSIRSGSSGGSATLAAGRTISIGSGGFNAGYLILRNFTQLGTTPQVLSLGASADLQLLNNCTFNGNLTTTSGGFITTGATYNGGLRVAKTGPSNSSSGGGNTFNGDVDLSSTGAGQLLLADAGADLYNGNISVNSTSTGGIRFGNSGGTSTLASGRTVSVGAGGFASGLLLFKNFSQVGTTAQTLTLGAAGNLYFFPGNTFNGNLTTTSSLLYLAGSTFNGTCTFTKTGPSGDNCPGGNTFNADLELRNVSISGLYMADSQGDIYNGNILVNNTSTGQIRFGSGAGTPSTLAAGRTVSVGSLGYSGGLLLFRYFNQVGPTPQSLNLGTAAVLYFWPNCVFDGDLATTSGGLIVWNSTFNGTAKFTKTGASGDQSPGGCTFASTLELVNTGTGYLYFADTGVDQYNGNVLVNNTSTGQIRFGNGGGSATLAAGRTVSVGSLGFNTGILLFRNFTQAGSTAQSLLLGPSASLYFYSGSVWNGPMTSTSGVLIFWGSTFNADAQFTKTGPWGDQSSNNNTFNGNVVFRNTGTGILYMADGGVDNYAGNIELNNTSTGQIRFGNAGGSSVLASGRTISVGSGGFNGGLLWLRNFTQLGTTPQNLVLANAASLYYASGSTFNGDITSVSGALFLNGSTFNGTSKFTKTSATGDACTGGNVFNGTTQLFVTGTGYVALNNSGYDQFNADLFVSNTSSGGIYFGNGGGSSTLANGKVIAVGSGGFNAGILSIRNFTQLGTTPQNLTLGTPAALYYATGNTFNGNIVSTSGTLLFNGTTFNGTGKFTKTGTSGDASGGGNIFNGTTELILTGSGNIGMNNTGYDQFNADLYVNNTSTGQILFGNGGGSSTLAAGKVVAVGSTGFNSGQLWFRNFTQVGPTPQTLNLGLAWLIFNNGTTFNGNVVSSSGSVFFLGTTFNGTGKFTKVNGNNDVSSGSNVFNGTAEFINTNTGVLYLHNTAFDQFNGDVLVESTNTGGIYFGGNAGAGTLAAGRTISVGPLGFASGRLTLRNFTQVGGTPQNLLLTGNSSLVYDIGTVFNGNVVSTCSDLYFQGATFNGTGKFTRTGPTSISSSGNNLFNGTAEFIVTGAGPLNMNSTGVDVYNGDILVNSTNAGGLSFGNAGGTTTLNAGHVITTGSTGWSAGQLILRNFTQLGAATTHSLVFTGGAINFNGLNTFNGTLVASAPNLGLTTSTFNGTSTFVKTGGSNNSCYGGNTFNGDMELRNQGVIITLAVSAPDVFNGNASFVRTGAGAIVVNNTYDATFYKNVSTLGSTGSVSFGAGVGRTIFAGTGLQTFSTTATAAPNVRNLTLNKPSGTLDLLGDVYVTVDMAFTSGVIRPQAATSTSNGLLIINAGVTFSDAADNASYVDGFVRKIGNTAFTFPVGNAGVLAPITMGAPGAATHHFTAKYVHEDPTPLYNTNLHDVTLNHLSHCEYWILDRTNSTTNVLVTLSFDSVRSCGVTNLAQLAVARWNGTTWKDHGNGGTTGTLSAGTVRTAAVVTSFSPFTLSSTTSNNPLPIELVSFTAQRDGAQVRTQWVTASEHNNERFEVERSADGTAFEGVGTLPGAGESQGELHYAFNDERPLGGLSYYRLKQVDLDGAFTYSDVVPVLYTAGDGEVLSVYPNPTDGPATLLVHGAQAGLLRITLMDMEGRVISSMSHAVIGGDPVIPVPLEYAPVGSYLVRVEQADGSTNQVRLVKR